MRSIFILAIGVIAGLAMSQLIDRIIGPRINNPGQTKPEDFTSTQPTDTHQQSSDSPFSTVESTSVESIVGVSDTAANNATTPDDVLEISQISLAEINHYNDLVLVLQHIDKADSEQLAELAQQLVRNQISQIDSFHPAINTAIFQRWAAVDIDAALEQIERSIHSEDPRDYLSMSNISTLASLQPDSVKSWLNGLEHSQRSMFEQPVYAGITSSDPEAFAREALASGDPDGMLYNAIMQWAEIDPAAAWSFLQTEINPDDIASRYSPLLYIWTERAPHEATAALSTLLENTDAADPQRPMLQGLFGNALAQSDPEAALQWISEIMTNTLQNTESQAYADELRYGLLPGIIHNVAQHNPLLVEQWIDQLSEQQQAIILPEAIPALLESLVYKDPQKALALAEQLPEQHGYDNRDMIVQQWIYEDRETAVNWLISLPNSVENEKLQIFSALSLIHEDIDAAMTVLNQVQGSLTPDVVLTAIVPLAMTKPESARQWLNQQSDPALIEAGTLLIEISRKTTPTTELLSRIENASLSGNRLSLVVEMLNQSSPQDIEIITHWVSSSTALNDQERTHLLSMLQPSIQYPDYGGFYTRHLDSGLSGDNKALTNLQRE